MEKSAKGNGLEVAYFEKYAIGTLDHSATLSQIKSLAPQWIFVTGYINDLLLVKKQMADQQIKATVVSMIAGPAYQEFIDAAERAVKTSPAQPGGILPRSMPARTSSERPRTT
jgi:branched-chain amino acid transport system substrate-binding protein